MSTRFQYEYRYTVEGWYTEAALAQGYTEIATKGDMKLTMKMSRAGAGKVSFYLIRLSEKDKEILLETPKRLSKARELFTRLCAKHQLLHERYNPQ